MKKKFLAIVIALILIMPLAFSLTACKGHKHVYENGTCVICCDHTHENQNGKCKYCGYHAHAYTDGTCSVCGIGLPSEGLEYELSKDGDYYIVKSSGTCFDSEVVIPSEYQGIPVKVIGANAFSRNNIITSVVIADSVTAINAWAFAKCENLKSVKFGVGLKEIGWCAFEKCTAIDKLYIPDSVETIDYGAFMNCMGVNELYIGVAVKSIGTYAFSYCQGIVEVTIPRKLDVVGDKPFIGCNKLIEIYNKSSIDIEAGSSENDEIGLYAKNVYTKQGQSKLSIDENGYIFYKDNGGYLLVGKKDVNLDTTLTLPESYDSQSYDLYYAAFRNCNTITEIVIPNGVKTIGDFAFAESDSVRKIIVSDSVESVGKMAFYACSSLSTVKLGSGVTTICADAFRGTYSLLTVQYNGTISDWDFVTKDVSWKTGSAIIKVECNDGNIAV